MNTSILTTWETLAQRNLAFRNILQKLFATKSVSKSLLETSLCIEGKFELIRMDSKGIIEFTENEVSLVGENRLALREVV